MSSCKKKLKKWNVQILENIKMDFQCTEIRVGSVVVQGTGHSTGKQ